MQAWPSSAAPPSLLRGLRLLRLLFVLVGIAFIGIAAWETAKTWQFLSISTSAVATVVDIDKSRGARGGNRYTPVYTFTDQAERQWRVKSASSTWRHAAYKIGDSITVHYLPADPNRSMVDRFFEKWGEALAIAVMGSVLIGFAGLFHWLRNTFARQSARSR